MRLFGLEIEGLPRLLVIFTTILLVASGLCGVQWATRTLMPNGPMVTLFMGLGILELITMVVSAAAIPILLLLWLVQRFTGWPPRTTSGVQSLFGEKNDG